MNTKLGHFCFVFFGGVIFTISIFVGLVKGLQKEIMDLVGELSYRL